MSQKQMLENEVLEEILRERATYYFSKKKILDFWLLIAPTFLKSMNLMKKIKATRFYKQQIANITSDIDYDFYSVLISSDKEFIKWIKLRLGYFEDLNDTENLNEEINFTSDGISGTLTIGSVESILKSNQRLLHPDILINKYKKGLEMYYKNSLKHNN
jgi:hypothetical protein